MKRLFMYAPVILLALFLLNSFVVKEKGAMLKSTDGGKTWQDISSEMPETGKSINFFAGGSDLYLQAKNGLYHSKGNIKTPVWEKVNVADPQNSSSRPPTAITFNRSGVMAYNSQGQIYQKMRDADNWSPVFTNFKNSLMQTIFETADGTVFIGYNHGLYRSTDKGNHWRQVQRAAVFNMVESAGVLVATTMKGIIRSTDNGEHWHWAINEGGIGLAVEQINGGFAAITYNTETKSRRIRTSFDHGKTWQAIDAGLRPSPSISSIKQMGKYLISGHPDGIFRSADGGKTWNSVYPTVDRTDGNAFKFVLPWDASNEPEPRKVFKIFVSDKALYAVAVKEGC